MVPSPGLSRIFPRQALGRHRFKPQPCSILDLCPWTGSLSGPRFPHKRLELLVELTSEVYYRAWVVAQPCV